MGSLPRLTVLVLSRCLGCSSVSDGQCKSRLTHVHVTISLQQEEEVMSSGQLALIRAVALSEKYTAGVEPKLKFGCSQYLLALDLGCRQTVGIQSFTSSQKYVSNFTLRTHARTHTHMVSLSILHVQFCFQ